MTTRNGYDNGNPNKDPTGRTRFGNRKAEDVVATDRNTVTEAGAPEEAIPTEASASDVVAMFGDESAWTQFKRVIR